MESIGAFLDGEWDCFQFQQMFAEEELAFTSNPFPGQAQLLLGQDEEVNFDVHSLFCSALEANIDMEHQRNYNFPLSTHSTNILAGDYDCVYMDIPSVEEMRAFSSCLADMLMEDSNPLYEESKEDIAVTMNPQHQPGSHAISGNQLSLKRKLDIHEFPDCAENKSNLCAENQKKKPRISREVQRTKRNAQQLKSHKQVPNVIVEEEIQAAPSAGQSYNSCSTEEGGASQEMNDGVTSSSKTSTTPHSNGKTRVSRGSATDSQSLYARRRRERINERLRVLQNLVPNGTKVDISTMLEEAVHYVKFLQLQIKLLSSDDHWMYAPIAYNGMDMGLTLNISKMC